MFYIYRLFINNITIYIGKSVHFPSRYFNHKVRCFSKKSKEYNSKKYLTIRQLGITKDNFYEFVKYEILYKNIPDNYGKIMEQLIINLYRDNDVNLFNDLNVLIDKKEKIICDICNKEIMKTNLKGHKEHTHKIFVPYEKKINKNKKHFIKICFSCF